jgi:hypothetical protein
MRLFDSRLDFNFNNEVAANRSAPEVTAETVAVPR